MSELIYASYAIKHTQIVDSAQLVPAWLVKYSLFWLREVVKIAVNSWAIARYVTVRLFVNNAWKGITRLAWLETIHAVLALMIALAAYRAQIAHLAFQDITY